MIDRTVRNAARAADPLAWVRVRIDATGHETDVRLSGVRDGMTVLVDYPPHRGLRPRPSKHFVGKDAQPATPTSRAKPASPAATTTNGEGAGL